MKLEMAEDEFRNFSEEFRIYRALANEPNAINN